MNLHVSLSWKAWRCSSLGSLYAPLRWFTRLATSHTRWQRASEMTTVSSPTASMGECIVSSERRRANLHLDYVALTRKHVPRHSYARHPSYAGFFYWALGTQVLLANPLGAAVFAVVLWRFFHDRIKGEWRSG